ncbi:MAG: BTAD domain-containing putative transcriptional regulator [Gammaproteobacteria bacterium]
MNNECTLPPMHDPVAAAASGTNPGLSVYRLRVYTLGRFTIVCEGRPMSFGRKSPGKPLQLLKALIASGGRQVAVANLAEILWPDKEGDLAQRAFEITLHRLRKHLGDDHYLLMEDGRLTLNSDLAWVDVWEFERQSTVLRGLLSRPVDRNAEVMVRAIGDRLMYMYQGHFLSREPSSSWSVSLEERIRSRFIHGMLALGRFWEERGLPEMAILCYEKGIVADDLVETFYQRLMTCLDMTGRQPEAIACYRQCRHVLSVVLGLQPAEETQHIYHSIISHRRLQAS